MARRSHAFNSICDSCWLILPKLQSLVKTLTDWHTNYANRPLAHRPEWVDCESQEMFKHQFRGIRTYR